MTGITIDGRHYNVRLRYETLKRTFALTEGENTGESISGRIIRDIKGTKYSYSLAFEPDPKAAEEYDAFYEAISAPVDYHTITMPYGQSSITFEAVITGGEDIYKGTIGGKERWAGLEINFVAIEPQRK